MKDFFKPCPGCGKVPNKVRKIMSNPDEGPGMGYYWCRVACECGWGGKSFRFKDAKEKATKFWNSRVFN